MSQVKTVIQTLMKKKERMMMAHKVAMTLTSVGMTTMQAEIVQVWLAQIKTNLAMKVPLLRKWKGKNAIGK